MGKGSNTTSTSSYSAPDAQAGGLYRDILQRAQGVANTPYAAYTGNLTAGENSQQNLGVTGANTASGYADPYIARAAQLAGASTTPVSSSDIFQYYDPYQQKVIDATTGQLQHDFGQQQAQLQGNQIAQGALGGNATGVAKGILAGQQARTLASTTAGLESQGFNTALQAAQRQQQTGLAGANAQAQYGLSGQNAAMQAAQLQYGLGTHQQATEQARLNALYQQYQQAQAYPYQQTQWLAGIGTGVGSNLGGSSSGTTTGPAPNQLGQYLGAGVAAAGLFLNRGGAVHGDSLDIPHMAEGGVSGTPWAGGVGWIPQINIHGGSGAPQAHAPSLPSQPQGVNAAQLANQITGLGAGGDWRHDFGGARAAFGAGDPLSGAQWGGGSFAGGDAYGGGMDNMLPGLTAEDYNYGDYADGGRVHGIAGYADGGAVELEQSYHSPYQIRPNGGQFQVINVRTGQVHYTGTSSGASNAQATLNSQNRARGGGVAGYAAGGPPTLYDPNQDENNPPATFGERFEGEPVPEGLPPALREMPRGVAMAHYLRSDPNATQMTNDFDTAGVVNPGDPVRLHGSTFGATPPVEAAGDDEETGAAPAPRGVAGPASAPPKPPVMAQGEDPYYARPDDRSGFGLGLLSRNAKTGLLTAGLGMLASRSPFLGNAIGEGGLAGLGAYGSAEEKDRKIALEAHKLSAEANKTAYDRWMGERKQGETERHNVATEAYNKGNLDRSKWTPAGQYMGDDGVYRPVIMNTATGEFRDSSGNVLGKDAKIEPKGSGKDGGFTDKDAEDIAERYVKGGDRTVLQGLGTSGAAKIKVNRAIKRVMDRENISPEEMSQRVVEFEGRKAGSRTLGGMEAKMGAAAFEAEGAIKLVRGVIEKLPRTSFLPFNKLLEGYSKNTLNPDQAELYARVQAIVNTYSAVMSRGANVTTDSSRHHAAELLNTAADPATFNRVLNTLQNEIDMAKGSPARMQEYYRKHYGPKSVESGTGSAGSPPSTAAGTGAFTPPPGAISQTHNGKTYYYDPTTKQPYPGQ